MPAKYTEDPDGWNFSRGASAQRMHLVINAGSIREAEAASPEPDVDPWQNTDNGHPDDRSLLCRPPVWTKKGPRSYLRTSNYGIPPGGSWTVVANDGTNAPTASFTQSILSYAVDRDLNGVPIMNAVGDFIGEGDYREIYARGIEIVLPEKYYRKTFFEQFIGTVNSQKMTLFSKFGQDSFSVDAYDLLCIDIVPAGPVVIGSKQKMIAYKFLEIREYQETRTKRTKLVDPHQRYKLHKGRHAWGKWADGTSSKGELVYEGGQPLNEDVLLDDKGIPFDKKLKVQRFKGGTLETVDVVAASPPEGLKFNFNDERAVKGVTKVLKFVFKGYSDFLQLKL